LFFFFPVGVDYRPRRFAWGTCLVIGVSACVYLLSARGFTFGETMRGILSLPPEFIAYCGFTPDHPTVGTFFFSLILHVNLFHIAANTLYLLLFAPAVEDVAGPFGFLLLYLVGGAIGILVAWGLALSILPDALAEPVVGASGALSCILGVFAVRFFFVRVKLVYFWWVVVATKFDILRVSAEAAIAIWLATEVGLGILSLFRPGARVAHWSHVMCFLVGVAIAQTAGMRLKALRDEAYRLERARRATEPLEAAGESEVAVACVPSNVEVQLQAARAWADLDDSEKAMSHLREAARIAIKCEDRRSLLAVYDTSRGIASSAKLGSAEILALSNALLAAGRSQEAVVLLDTIWREHPESPEARIAILRAAEVRIEKLGHPEEGKELLERFCRDHPDSEWLGHVKAKLDSLPS
jgi:membrane associated rhomboid family serine protease